ncbi:MAG: hypothetical protein J0I09_15020 [Sphingobacteriia bacterium]|nr:hypothetical protein [Sphingobacteriia bacterium]
MTLKTKGIFLGLFCLLFGGLLFYFQGYKDNSYIKYLSLGLVYLGWIIFLGSLFGTILLTDKKIRFVNHKFLWFKDKTIKLLIYASFGIGIVGTMEFTSKFGTNRVNQILQTEPTENAIGTIIKIDSRNTRGGPKLWAIIEYQTKKVKVTQAVYDYNEKYSVGQKYLLRYSINNPQMFKIVERQK